MRETVTRTTIGLLLIILWVSRVAAVFFPQARLWGINHLQFLPDFWTWGYIAAGGVVILFGLPLFQPAIDRASKFLAQCFDRGVVVWGPMAGLSMVVFWFLRMPTNLLGDGYSVINNIGGSIPVVLKWSESGAVALVYAVSRVLPVEGLARGEYAYALVSVVSGGAALFFMAKTASVLGQRPIEKLVLFWLWLCSGWLLLFFGYAENYPALWAVMSAYLYCALRYLQGNGSLLLPIVLLAAAVVMHMQAIFWVPSLVYLFFARGKGNRFYLRYRVLVWVGVAVAITASLIGFVFKYQSSLFFRSHFLTLWSGKPVAPDYTIFSLPHLVDGLNLLSLVMPLWPALLVVWLATGRRIKMDAVDNFLALGSLGGLVFLAVVDPRLGLGRDWDIFALAGLGPALLFGRRLISSRLIDWQYLPIMLLTALMVVPYFLTNLQKEPSISYVESLMQLDKGKSRSGQVMLRNYLADNGQTEWAEAVDRRLREWFPQIDMSDRVFGLIQQEQYDRAMVLIDSIYRLDPYSVDGFNLKGQVFQRQGKYDEALACMKQSAELAPYESRAYTNLAELYSFTKNDSLMWFNLRRAQRLNPQGYEVMRGLAMAFYWDKRYDSSMAYGQRLMELYPEQGDGYLALGLNLVAMKRYEHARELFDTYLEIMPPGRDREMMRQNLANMLADKASGK